MTPNTIEELYSGLNYGKSYILKKRLQTEISLFMEGVHRYFTPQCNLVCDYRHKYIHWHNAGSSAEQNTIERLEWLLDEIFDGAKPEDFVELSYNTMLDVMNGEYGEVR